MNEFINDLDKKISKAENITGNLFDDLRDIRISFNRLKEAINYTPCCKSDSEQLNVSFNVGDKVLFDNKRAVVLWTSVNYLDIEIAGTNKILQGVHTSKVLPR